MTKVLLIEPDKLLARTYAQVMRQVGHDVRSATTAQAAIDAADDMSPEVVLLELQLVIHSGIEFLYEFRSYPDWQAVPIIILSNVPPAELKQSASVLKEQLGVQAYCYKPYTSLSTVLQIVGAIAVVT